MARIGQQLLSREPISWAVFDWGNSAISTIIFTFIFPVYFAAGIFGDDTQGAALWSFAIAIAGLVTALSAPLFGGMADFYGPRKPLLGALCLTTIASCVALTFAAPDSAWIWPALILAGLATVSFELGQSVYNSMLYDMAPVETRGRLSGLAWGMGYFGGLMCLVLALFGLIGLGDMAPWLSLPDGWYRDDIQMDVRLTCFLAGLWMAVFILPLFLICPDRAREGRSLKQAAWMGASDLTTTLKTVWNNKNLRLYLIGSAIYRDGLITLFAVGGLYAADKFSMGFADILIFAIGLNVTAGLGAMAFSFLDDKAGPKLTIILSLIGLILCGLLILFAVQDKDGFIAVALVLGVFIGPAQSAGRVLMSRLSPSDEQTSYFGLYAMTGKAAAFTGPFLYGLMVSISGDQNWGLATILALWSVGLVFILFVKERNNLTAHD